MFKKAFKAQTQSLLKKSDARKFREQLRKVFSLSEEQLNLLFTAKDEVGTRSVQGTYTVIYFANGVPLFFDPESKERYVPTVYAMWRVPTILPSLAIHAGVLKYIVGGANLMLPGVVLPEGGISALGEFKKGDTRAIVIHGTNVPVAVGYMDLGAMALNRQGKMEGQGMQVLHFWRDQLWAMGPKEAPPALMNAPEATAEAAEEVPAAALTMPAPNVLSPPLAAAQPTANTTDGSEPMPAGKAEKSDTSSTGLAKPLPAAASVISAPPEAITKSTVAGGAEGGNKEAMDELLKTCFLFALKRSLKDKDLPILLNLFFSNHLLAVKPKDEVLDMKKTSYKKISKFIGEMEEKGLVKTAEPSTGVIQIISVNRVHPLYTACKAPKMEKKEEKEELSDSPMVAELFKPHSGLALVMGDVPEKDYYRRKDLLDILWTHVAKLPSAKQSATVALDFALSEGVYQKQKKVGEVVEKKDLAERFLTRTAKFYSVTRNGETEIHKGLVPTIAVQQKLRGGRHTTVITGLEGFGFDAKELDNLASELKSHFACAASVQEATVGTGAEIMVQGHVGREVQVYLAQQLSIPQRYLELNEGTGKK